MALAPGIVAVAVVLAVAAPPSPPPGPPPVPFPEPPVRPSPLGPEAETCVWLGAAGALRNGCGEELPPSCVWLTAEPPGSAPAPEEGARRGPWAPEPCRPPAAGHDRL